MRVIEQQMITAINEGKNWHNSNTTVHHDSVIGGTEIEVKLFGNLIAKRYLATGWEITLAGWDTNTTRSRLNVLLNEFTDGYYVFRHKGKTYLNTRGGLHRAGSNYMTPDEWVKVS